MLIPIKCQWCGESKSLGRINVGKFCSLRCCWESRKKRETTVCKLCKTAFVTKSQLLKIGRSKYCSAKCRNQDLKGSNSPYWKGGASVHQKRWASKNKDKITFYGHRRRMRERNSEGFHTLEEWTILKEKYSYMCLCCKKSEPEIKLSVDHIIPLSKGGTDNIDNIQPLCLECNGRKWTKTIDYRPYQSQIATV